MKEFGHPRRSHMPPGAGNQAQVSEKRFHTSLRVGIQLWHIVTCQNQIWPLAPCAPITLFFNNWHDDVNAPDAKVGLGLDPNQSGCTNQGSQLSRLDWVNRGHLKLGQPDPVGLVFNQTWLWPDSSQPDLCLTIPGEITSSMLAYKKKKGNRHTCTTRACTGFPMHESMWRWLPTSELHSRCVTVRGLDSQHVRLIF